MQDSSETRADARGLSETRHSASTSEPGTRNGRQSNPIAEAADLLAADMGRFEQALAAALEPQRQYLTDAEYDMYRLGKKIRPLLLLLSARLVFSGPPEEELEQRVIEAAVSTEMLHVATLIHDDIVDRAPVRRGMPSINAARGTALAILIGDLQFVQAIRCFANSIDTEKDMNLVRLVLSTAFRICCGEIDEIQTGPNWAPDELRVRYMQTIERKTAVLFGLACECGAALGGARSSEARRIGFFGRRVGRAFQIMDDLFDIVASDQDAGKAQGTDIAQRRLSLPIIYAMEELGPDHLLSRIMRGAEFAETDLRQAIHAVRRSDACFRAAQDARAQIFEGLHYLHFFPRNHYRNAMNEIAYYVVNRGYDG